MKTSNDDFFREIKELQEEIKKKEAQDEGRGNKSQN